MSKSENKTQITDKSVDDFLNTVADEQKRQDAFTIKSIMEEISGEPAKMWGTSIVGFGTYHYKYASGREGDFMKTGFSPRARNLSIYIMTGFDRHDEIIKDLGKYKTGKSCLYVKKLSDIDEKVLKKLIKASYDHMTKKYG